MLRDSNRFKRWVGGGIIERSFLNGISRIQLFLLGNHKNLDTVALIRKVRRERRSLLTAYECFTVHSLALAAAKREGAIAEVGVFQGCSAKLICEVKGCRDLFLFDTFEGLPESTAHDGGVHDAKQYACSLESVQDYLKAYSNVRFFKGCFPESAATTPDCRYSFVHLDVDLYASTLSCLQYFYPRMLPGGVILSHDYSVLNGVKTAFTEFLADKPEAVIEQPSTQCMIIKT